MANRQLSSSEEDFFKNVDAWIRMPDLQQKQQDLENKLYTLETLLDYELKGNKAKTLYTQKSNIYFLRKADEVKLEKRTDKEKIETEIQNINKELTSLTRTFQQFKQNVVKTRD